MDSVTEENVEKLLKSKANKEVDLENVKIAFDLGLTDYEAATVTHIKNLISGGQIVGLEEATRIVSVLVAAHNSSNQGHSPIQISDSRKFKSQVFTWA